MPVKRIRENAVENELVARVIAAGGVADKVIQLGCRGYFDRIVVLPTGRVFFVECKRPRGGIVSPHQRRRHALYKSVGATVVIVKNSEDITRLLRA